MPSVLIIAEKPNAAAKIAAALSNNRAGKKPGKVASYEFVRPFKNASGTDGSGKEVPTTIYVAPAVGHLYGLMAKKGQSGYPVFETEWAPSSVTGDGADFQKPYLALLHSLAKKADLVINACDFDVEGSLIGYKVIEFAGKTKNAKRMKFSTLVASDLVDAFEKLQPLDLSNAKAGETRHVLDWLYGINLSRALMAAIKAAGSFRPMSTGRVQGPTLAVLAHREKSITAFKPEPYWELHAHVLVDHANNANPGIAETVDFEHVSNPFQKQEDAAKAETETTKSGTITSIEKRQVKQLPPFPYDLTSLQVDAYRNFGISPANTIKVAQTLYEDGAISYPRTSSQKLPPSLNLKKILEALATNPTYEKSAKWLLAEKRTVPHDGPKEDAAHPALHPTGQKPGASIGEWERKLYDLIVKRFFATLGPNALRESRTVKALFGTQEYKTTGSITLEEGWLPLFAPYAHFEETVLPAWKECETVTAKSIEKVEKETTPPKRYSPASLIKKLEKAGLGTKATRSTVIETLFDRGYLTDRKSIKVTPFGMTVYEALHNHSPMILSEKLTREIEAEMDAIAEKNEPPEKALSRGREVLTKILTKFKTKEAEIGKELLVGLKEARKEMELLGPCPACVKEGRAGQIAIRKGRFGLFIGCNAYPNCKQTFPLPKMAAVQPTKNVCEHCHLPIVLILRKGKRPFNMCITPGCKSKDSWGSKWQPKEGHPAFSPSGGAPGPNSADAPTASTVANAEATPGSSPTNTTSTPSGPVVPGSTPATAIKDTDIPDSSDAKPAFKKPYRKSFAKPKNYSGKPGARKFSKKPQTPNY